MKAKSARSRLRAALLLNAAVGLFFGACAVDQREVELSIPGLNADGGVTTSGSGGAFGGDDAGSTAIGPRLELDVEALDFGPVVLGTPSLATVRASNTGDAILPVPQVALSGPDSDFSILQNRCTEPLEPGAECQIRLQFLPVATGVRSNTVSVTTAGGEVVSAALTGEGLELGNLALSPDATSSPDFGGVVVGQSREATFALINLGDVDSGLLTLSLVNAEFQLLPPTGTDCVSGVTSLAPSATCNIRVAFTPSRRDELAAATLTVASTAVGGSSLNLTGIGLAPAEVGVAAEVSFGNTVLGQATRGNVEIQNLGDEPLTAPTATLEGADAASFALIENGCSSEIPARESCTLSVEFRPQRPDSHAAELVLTDAAGETRRVALVGTGLQPGALVITAGAVSAATEFDFGAVVVGAVSPPTQVFQISNPGGVSSGPLDIDLTSITGGLFARASTSADGDCIANETSLEPGQICSLQVSFQPSAPGPSEGSLTITSTLAGSTGVRLIGSGLAPARLTLVSAAFIDFGQVITNEVKSADITLRNDGDETLRPPSFAIVPSGTQAAEFTVSGCAAPLDRQATCTAQVQFRPTVSGPHSGSLRISAGSAGETSVGLLGRGVPPGSLAVTPRTATFVATVNGTSAPQTFTVSNPGANSGPLRFNASPVADFDLQPPRAGSTDCVFNQTSLAENQSCTLVVVFDPEVRSVSALGSLEVTSSSAGTVSVQLTGTAQTPATLSGTTSTGFGTVNVGATASFSWRVTNTGDVASSALTLSNSNTGDFGADMGCAASLAPGGACTVTVTFRPQRQNNPNTPLAANITLTGTGTTLTLRATGNGRQLVAPGGACSATDSSATQCSRAGDVCSFNHSLGGGGAVCCNSACPNPCDTCNAMGTCSPRGGDPECGTGGVGICRNGLCLAQDGQPCALGSECASTNCEQNRRICCARACGAGQRCTANGAACETSPRGVGEQCGVNADCANNRCIDATCCGGNGTCNGLCEACNVPGSLGTCSFVADNSCPTRGQVCQARGSCDFPDCVVNSLVGQCEIGN